MMLSRRRLLGGAVAVAVGGVSAPCRAHNNAGIVDPEGSPPEVRLVLDDERRGRLRQQLAGRVTALQMMFTSCQATCPIQGAIFGQAAGQLGDHVKNAQWLSVSIDPTIQNESKRSPGAKQQTIEFMEEHRLFKTDIRFVVQNRVQNALNNITKRSII